MPTKNSVKEFQRTMPFVLAEKTVIKVCASGGLVKILGATAPTSAIPAVTSTIYAISSITILTCCFLTIYLKVSHLTKNVSSAIISATIAIIITIDCGSLVIFHSTTLLWLRLRGTLDRFCMEPFRVGIDRLPVYTMSWNRSVQNRSFPVFTHDQFLKTVSLPIHQEQEKYLKKFSHHTHVH